MQVLSCTLYLGSKNGCKLSAYMTKPLKLKNTLTGNVEDFKPLHDKTVRMYNCGPTVYDYAHIGNMRAYIFADILRRTLEWNGYKVNQIVNITDVGHLTSDADQGEDKIEKGALREGKNATQIIHFYTQSFLKDIRSLHIKVADEFPMHFPKATEHIGEQIELIQTLEQKGFIYKTSDGIYFDTSKFSNYGKLGSINIEGLESGARVEENQEKKNITDFALWKFSKEGEHRQQEWESPWGKGFPGWHLECSAMSMKYLGETFDIHTGGVDHIPVHHNNEIAQSEGATGKPFVHFWVHCAFITVDGKKVSKSEGNAYRLDDLVVKNIEPLAYRYFTLQARYSTTENFTWQGIKASQTALTKLRKQVEMLGKDFGSVNEKYKEEFENFINDDLDTPKALALVWELLKDDMISPGDKRTTILSFDKILGLDVGYPDITIREQEQASLPKEIQSLVEDRENARISKDWQKSDEIRKTILEKGYVLKDTQDGVKVFLV